MFWRLVFKLLRGSSGRLAVAVLALVSGGAVISALINLDLDVEHKLTREFRSLGANVVISPGAGAGAGADNAANADASAGSTGSVAPALIKESEVVAAMQRSNSPSVLAAAPFLYVVARSSDVPVVVAGTWLDQLQKLNPSWRLEGNWIASRDDASDCLVGRNVARKLDLSTGGTLSLQTQQQPMHCTVTGVIDAGANEDNQVFASLGAVQTLASLPGGVSLAQLSVNGPPEVISGVAASLSRELPADQVRPVRDVAEAEGALLARIRLLIVAMVILILALTALCVLGTMAALAMERREDVGLMKALGGSIARVVGIFLAEVGVLGAAGGVVGSLLGFALSYWMGLRVFGTAISPRWIVFPITVALMILVALAGALPLRLLGRVKPAAILRGE